MRRWQWNLSRPVDEKWDDDEINRRIQQFIIQVQQPGGYRAKVDQTLHTLPKLTRFISIEHLWPYVDCDFEDVHMSERERILYRRIHRALGY
jgi:hypothetical protein